MSVALFDTELGPSAVIVAVVRAVTFALEIVKVPVVIPAPIEIVAGKVTDFRLLESAIFSPPTGDGSFKVTVPVDVDPPAILAGLSVTFVTVGGLSVRAIPIDDGESEAFIFATVTLATDELVMLNEAEVAPAATTMLVGVLAEVELLERVTFVPAAGAGPFKATVPTQLAPPAKVLAFRVNRLKPGGLIANVAETELVFSVALIAELVLAATGFVETEKVAVVAPLCTVTEVGTVTDVLAELSVTTLPPDGAFAEMVTVPVDEEPPTTDEGDRTTLLTV